MNTFDPNHKIVEKIITDTKYFVIFVVIGAIMFGFVLQKCNRDSNESQIKLTALLRILNFEKESYIIKKGIDSTHRNTPYIIFSDGEKIDIDDRFYRLIEVDDSVSKKKSFTIYSIYRYNRVLTYNYLVED